MKPPFPLLLSIPHGGTEIPSELVGRAYLSAEDQFHDSDAFTGDIYDLEGMVEEVVFQPISRAYVDLNRSSEDSPPENPDGVIKSETCYGIPIYRKGLEPDEQLSRILLERYYWPYHNRLREKLFEKREIKLALDCHSMAALGPPAARDRGEPRPTICLGDLGGRSCPSFVTLRLADCLRQTFDLEKEEVAINRPFSGGHIIRSYGNRPVPWIQVELNRDLYLKTPWWDRKELTTIDTKRIKELRGRFLRGVELFFREFDTNWA